MNVKTQDIKSCKEKRNFLDTWYVLLDIPNNAVIQVSQWMNARLGKKRFTKCEIIRGVKLIKILHSHSASSRRVLFKFRLETFHFFYTTNKTKLKWQQWI